MSTKKDILNTLAKRNSFKYNHKKAAEELCELAAVLLKKINKRGGPKEPDDQEIIDEIGDVEVRIKVLKRLYSHNLINERIDFKLDTYAGYIKENKYKNI